MKLHISAVRAAACATALAIFMSATLPANAQNTPVILRLGTIQASNNPIVAGMKRFAELVDAGTHGRVVVQTFDTGTLGAALPEIHNVRVGTQEMFADGCTWLGALIPDWNLCAIPYMNNNYTTAAQMMHGPIGQKLNQEFSEQQHIVVLANDWYRSVRELETTRPVNAPSDLKDLKIRVPGMPDFVVPWQTYGANAVPLDLGQTFVALQQGVVVGTDTPLDITALFHFQEVEKYVSAINWLYEPIVLLINQDVWNRLSKSDQRVLLDSATAAGKYQNNLVVRQFDDYVRTLKKAGMTFLTPNTRPWREESKKIPAALLKSGHLTDWSYKEALRRLDAPAAH